MENCPNVLIVPHQESPEDIIEDYEEVFQVLLDEGVSLRDILYDFFNEVNMWSCKQFLIDSAKQHLQELENINNYEKENYFNEDDE